MRSIRTVLLGVAALLLLPAAASAQKGLTVFVGGNFGGDSGVSLHQSIDDTSRLTVGARLRVIDFGVASGEIDVGRTSGFYGKGTVFDSSSVLTLMGTVKVGVPALLMHPYAVVGAGLVRRSITYAAGQGGNGVSDTRAAYTMGAGVDLPLLPLLGFNVDVRYFRNLSKGNNVLDLPDDAFNFVRASVGVSLRF